MAEDEKSAHKERGLVVHFAHYAHEAHLGAEAAEFVTHAAHLGHHAEAAKKLMKAHGQMAYDLAKAPFANN